MAEQHRMDNGSGWPGASRPGMPPQSGMGRMQGAPGNRPSAPPYGAGFVRPEQPRDASFAAAPAGQRNRHSRICAFYSWGVFRICALCGCRLLDFGHSFFCNRPWKASARTGHRRIGNISCIAVDIDCGLCRHFCNRFCG